MRNLIHSRININLLKHNLKSSKAYLVLFTILFFISFPASYIVKYLRGNEIYSYIMNYYPITLIVFAALAMFFIPFITQGYLNSKKAVDVYHALPIKRSDIYLTNALSSFLVVFVPYTLNYLFGYLFLSMINIDLSAHRILLYYVYSGILLLAIQTCNNFVIMNTGTLANGLVHSVVLFLAPFVAYGAFSMFVESFIFGVSAFDDMILSYISPTYGLFRLLPAASQNQLLVVGFVWLVVNIAFTCLNLSLYNKRKSERSEDPFTNERYFPVVASLFTGLVLIGLMATFTYATGSSYNKGLYDFLTLDTFVIPLGISFTLYIILDIFRYKSTKHFGKAVVKFFIIAATTVSLGVALIATNFLGYGNYIPAVSSVREVRIVSNSPYAGLFSSSVNSYVDLTLTDTESIQEVIDFHKNIHDFYKQNSDFSYENSSYTFHNSLPASLNESGFDNVTIEYRITGGFKINRSYIVPYSISAHLYTLLDNFEVQKSQNKILDTSIPLRYNNSVQIYNETMTQFANVTFTPTKREALLAAYQKDLESLDAKTLAFEQSELRYILNYTVNLQDTDSGYYYSDSESSLLIDSRFTNTVSYIDSLIEEAGFSTVPVGIYSTGEIIDMYNWSRSGIATITSSEEKEFLSISNEILLTQAEAQELSGTISGSFVRSNSKRVYIASVNNRLYFLPLNDH